jgi:translation initiation factor 2B subunit (eIF-2B alpha/beta/delta family)
MRGVVNDGHFNNVNDMIKVVRDVFDEVQSIVHCDFFVGDVAKRCHTSLETMLPLVKTQTTVVIAMTIVVVIIVVVIIVVINVVANRLRQRNEQQLESRNNSTGGSDSSIRNPNLLEIPQSETSLKSRFVDAVRVAVISTPADFNEEIDNVVIPINNQALDHVHNVETISAYGHNFFALELLKKASSSPKKFSVIIAKRGTGPGPKSPISFFL